LNNSFNNTSDREFKSSESFHEDLSSLENLSRPEELRSSGDPLGDSKSPKDLSWPQDQKELIGALKSSRKI